MLKLFKRIEARIFPPKKSEPRPISPYRFGYTLDYFRSSESRVDGMRELLRSPLFQAAMSVLQHEIPLDSIEAVRGHRRALRLLELMAEAPEKSIDRMESTFGAEKEIDLQEDETNQPEE